MRDPPGGGAAGRVDLRDRRDRLVLCGLHRIGESHVLALVPLGIRGGHTLVMPDACVVVGATG